MAYKTLVASSATQQRWTIDSNAHTLQELKEEFRQNNIPFEGLAITEGLCTKAELTRDDAEIPVSQRTVNYNGETYSRVFLITNARKQIASGAYDRKALYAEIKRLNLQEDIKQLYGKNYTMVGNEQLADAIAAAKRGSSCQEELEEVRKELSKKPEVKVPDVKTAPHAQTVEWLYTGIKSMVRDNSLFADDIAVLAGLATELYQQVKEPQKEVTDSDLEDMLWEARY